MTLMAMSHEEKVDIRCIAESETELQKKKNMLNFPKIIIKYPQNSSNTIESTFLMDLL